MGVEASIMLERSKNKMVHNENHPTHNRETHGTREDIDVNTPISDVKGPNVFERVKEEFEAIVEAVHHHKEDKSQDSPSAGHRGSPSPRHHKETHGKGKDIDADIPISEFKGPSILHRAKEEIEAIIDTIHSKKDAQKL